MTYDRELVKFDEAEGVARPLLPTSEHVPQQREFRWNASPEGWADGTDATGWQTGAAPFQSGDDANSPTGTVWPEAQIWMRTWFDLAQAPDSLWIEAYHAIGRGEIYLNGQRILDFAGTRPGGRHYHHMDLSAQATALRPRRNVLAATGQPAGELRGLDLGLYAVE